LLNGDIYTVNPEQPWVEAIAIQDGAIVFVGSDADVQPFIGGNTEVTDLGGRMAMPGLHDSHMHLLEAFHFGFTCFLPPNVPIEGYIPIIQQCAPFQVGTDWVIGFGHSIERMLDHITDGGRSPIEILDDAVPDGPAVMMESTSHSVWVNTEAMEVLGLDGGAEPPTGGAIVRYPDGRETGLLLDGAGELAMDTAFGSGFIMDLLNRRALRDGLEAAAENGITSIADARAYWRRGYVDAYEVIEADGDLTARVTLGLWAYPYLDDEEQIASLASMYSNDPSSLLKMTQVKAYSDGEVSHTTAALLEPYEGLQLTEPTGLNYFNEERLTTYIEALEPVGFDFHIHTIGDRGVHEAFNAIEAARATNGDLGRRHHLTHLEIIAPEDISRFNELGVIPDFQMSSSFVKPQNLGFYSIHLGEDRARERVLRLRDVYDTGAPVVLSSDYDVGSLSPFVGMENALTLGAQSLPDVDAAVRAYTSNAAYLMQQEHLVGTLEVGKRADLVVLDQNIFDVELSQIGSTKVLWTIVDGETVFTVR